VSIVPVPLGPSVVVPVPEEDPVAETELPLSVSLDEGLSVMVEVGPSALVVVLEGDSVEAVPEGEAEVEPIGPVVEPETMDPAAEPVG